MNAVLLERDRLTAGTTWHTAGLFWRLRPNDVDIQYAYANQYDSTKFKIHFLSDYYVDHLKQ